MVVTDRGDFYYTDTGSKSCDGSISWHWWDVALGRHSLPRTNY